MNNEIERYVGELRDLRRVHHTIVKNHEEIRQWITWLDAEIRQKVMSEWQKENKKELKLILEQLLLTSEMLKPDSEPDRQENLF